MKISEDELFAALWRFLQLAVHKYGTGLTGEVLVVMTIVILDRAGYRPTIAEITKLTGLPKSTVSRYISNQFSVGHLTEEIDSKDRRRRVLLPTEAGKREINWISKQVSKVADTVGEGDADLFRVLGQPEND